MGVLCPVREPMEIAWEPWWGYSKLIQLFLLSLLLEVFKDEIW